MDLLESADKLGNQIIKVQNSNDRFHLRLGELNYRIAAMHHGHIVESDIENKERIPFSNKTASIKLGCVVRMVVGSILPHAECGPNDHEKTLPRL